MKRLVLLLLLLISAQIHAQYFKIGLKEGMTASQISGDSYKGFTKRGFTGGTYFKVKLKKAWTIGAEVVYTQKGSRHNSNFSKGEFDSYFLQLDYIDIPILVQYNFSGNFNLELGPGYSFLTHTREFIISQGLDSNGKVPFHKEEITINVGLNYTFNSRFGYNIRFSNSALPIRTALVKTNIYKYGQLNTVLSFSLTYEFGKEGSMWK